jgi:hypothetical protein
MNNKLDAATISTLHAEIMAIKGRLATCTDHELEHGLCEAMDDRIYKLERAGVDISVYADPTWTEQESMTSKEDLPYADTDTDQDYTYKYVGANDTVYTVTITKDNQYLTVDDHAGVTTYVHHQWTWCTSDVDVTRDVDEQLDCIVTPLRAGWCTDMASTCLANGRPA